MHTLCSCVVLLTKDTLRVIKAHCFNGVVFAMIGSIQGIRLAVTEKNNHYVNALEDCHLKKKRFREKACACGIIQAIIIVTDICTNNHRVEKYSKFVCVTTGQP